jgi:hypothetical protein
MNYSSYTLYINDQAGFSATVTGGASSASRAVNWSIQEGSPNGGYINQGTYRAPAYRGLYHIVATSVADSTKKGVVPVTVKGIYCDFSCTKGGGGNNWDLHSVDITTECDGICTTQCRQMGGGNDCSSWRTYGEP